MEHEAGLSARGKSALDDIHTPRGPAAGSFAAASAKMRQGADGAAAPPVKASAASQYVPRGKAKEIKVRRNRWEPPEPRKPP